MTSPAPTPTRYFGFGSNLWKQQMSLRCPTSPFTGIGRLCGYKWFINGRGYANIAPITTASPDSEDEVWGLVYDLSPADEARLDINEGVPFAYEKRHIPVEFWPVAVASLSQLEQQDGTGADGIPEKGKGQVVDMLVYIDFKRSQPGHRPRAEYVHRMNMGIRDALREGVPQAYVERVLRPYIPADAELDAEAVDLAKRQAAGFRDDSGVIPGIGLPPAGVAGSGVVSSLEMGAEEDEAEELAERASEVCYLKDFGV